MMPTMPSKYFYTKNIARWTDETEVRNAYGESGPSIGPPCRFHFSGLCHSAFVMSLESSVASISRHRATLTLGCESLLPSTAERAHSELVKGPFS